MWEALDLEPRPVSEVVHSGAGLEALRRLADAGLATLAAFTPSDAMHVLDRQQGWSREAAEYGARILATEERNARAARAAVSPQAICERTYEHVVRETGRVLLAAALAQDPVCRREGAAGANSAIDSSRRPLPDGASRRCCRRRSVWRARWSRSARRWVPTIRRWLAGSARRCSIPAHAAVCNAVGAVAGVVSQTVEILVNQPTFKVFRVHDPAGSQDYPEPEPALEHARRISRELALAAARRAGAADPHVETSVSERARAGGSGCRLSCGGGGSFDGDGPAARGPRRRALRKTGRIWDEGERHIG